MPAGAGKYGFYVRKTVKTNEAVGQNRRCAWYSLVRIGAVLGFPSSNLKSDLRENPADHHFDNAQMHYLDAGITDLCSVSQETAKTDGIIWQPSFGGRLSTPRARG